MVDGLDLGKIVMYRIIELLDMRKLLAQTENGTHSTRYLRHRSVNSVVVI